MLKRRLATRAHVISDLHLGGETPYMMSRASQLAGFIEGLAAQPAARPDDEGAEGLELVIAGDFVDFLAMPLEGSPPVAFTTDPGEACAKLRHTMKNPPFGAVGDALGRVPITAFHCPCVTSVWHISNVDIRTRCRSSFPIPVPIGLRFGAAHPEFTSRQPHQHRLHRAGQYLLGPARSLVQ